MVTDRMGGSAFTGDHPRPRVFSTSYIALSRLVETKAIDEESIGAFFHLGYFPGRRTALRDVSVHPYATVTTIRAGRVETTPYWRPNLEIDRARPRDEQLRAGVDAFNTTVRESCAGRSQARLAITAGLDSRSVASSLLRQRIAFDAYTHGFPGCWEGKRVEKIVRRHGIAHRFVPLVESS
jgi:asparagine synthetase B (glutamine-hydrolysing)